MTGPEPSVLDFLKSRLPWSKQPPIQIPAPRQATKEEPGPSQSGVGQAGPAQLSAERDLLPDYAATAGVSQVGLSNAPAAGAQTAAARPYEGVLADPWRSILALGCALLAQITLEPPQPSPTLAIPLYILATGLLTWAALRGEWSLSPLAEASPGKDPQTFRSFAFFASVPFAILAFLFLSDNRYTLLNVALWLIATGLFVWSLWLSHPGELPVWRRLGDFLRQHRQIRIDRWTLLILAATAVVVFFRFYHIQQTPAEPFSDHAEKILDLYDISQGQTHIFFPRNTGREDFQMYWSLVTSWVFGTGLTFLTLKIGTALNGLITLPFMYFLGKEVAGRRVGLLTFLLAGIGYWPNTISRIGLRFPLYMMFAAPLMLFLVRGLRRRSRNDFILAGIFLGLGLHGYSPYRIVPFLVLAAFILFILHQQSKDARRDAIIWFIIVGLTSVLVFLPLLRYATDNPEMFSYRALTRLESLEQPLPAPWYVVLASNTWNALRMFNWKDGIIWVHSVPDRPALDIVTGALFVLGVILLLVRYLRDRHWLDLFLLLSVPILLLPSILSLAFPDENPSLNRTVGAVVPVFLISAMALDGFITALTASGNRRILAYGVVGILLVWSAAQNFDLVFHQFDQNFRNNAWNTSDMGELIKQFRQTYGETDTVWIVPFPYWVDTRLPGMYAGIPNRDFALWPNQLSDSLQFAGPKLFMLKANLQDPSQNDQQSISVLQQLYPQGILRLYKSPIPNHDFWTYSVAATTTP